MTDKELIKVLEEDYQYALSQLDYETLENIRKNGYVLDNDMVVGLSLIELDLKEIPIEIFALSNLKKLVLFGNKLEFLSEGFEKLSCLESIYLGMNHFEKFPFVLTRLTNLKCLHIGANYIQEIPKEISILDKLEDLSLTNNQLSSIPDSFYKMKYLRALNISYNKLETIPDSFENLIQLEKLDLRHNHLKCFPNVLLCLKSLSFVRLEFNDITELPSKLLEMKLPIIWASNSDNNGFFLGNNPINIPPIKIIRKGIKSIQTYFDNEFMKKNMPKIFVSYSHNDTEVIDKIELSFKKYNITLIRDIRDVKYRKSFTEFMKNIRTTDYVLMILSDSFLKSRYCMFEVVETMKDMKFENRILPIVLDNTNIYSEVDKIKYLKYWKNEMDNIEAELHELDTIDKGSSIQSLKKFKEILMNIGEFINFITDLKHIKIDDINEFSASEILESINFFENTKN